MKSDSADDANDQQIEIDHCKFQRESCLMHCFASIAIAAVYFYFNQCFLN